MQDVRGHERRRGRWTSCTSGAKRPPDRHSGSGGTSGACCQRAGVRWLHTHYSGNGFKFAIVIDLSVDYDYEEPTETLVYFLDEITEEVLDYAGLKLANEDKV